MLFPPDVSLRMVGEGAQQLIPLARQLLSRALRLQETGGSGGPVKLMHIGTDGSLVYCFLHGNIKQLYLQPAVPVVPGKPQPEVLEVTEDRIFVMLSGVVRPATLLTVEERTLAHEFHPTTICAEAYHLDYAYQDMVKLGLESIAFPGSVESRWPKPSMYSGAMQRVVQAIYGLGRTGGKKTTGEDLAGAGLTEVRNPYRFDWFATHGVVHDAKGSWLIEVSRDRGVLKMRLPLLAGSERPEFRHFIKALGDSETVGILTEFRGLPSGGTFPTNDAALAAAIKAGSVLQLLPAAAISRFYVEPGGLVGGGDATKRPLYNACGWAFSGLGTVCHNTTFWYSNENFAAAFNTSFGTELLEADPGISGGIVAPLNERAMRAEHWQIELAVPAISQVEAGLLAGDIKQVTDYVLPGVPDYYRTEMLRVTFGATDELALFDYWGRPPTFKLDEIAAYNDLDCPVLVFFEGEVLRVIRHQRGARYGNGYVSGIFTHNADLGSFPVVGSESSPSVLGYRTSYEDHAKIAVPGGGYLGSDWSTTPPPFYDFGLAGNLYDKEQGHATFATAFDARPHINTNVPVAPYAYPRRWELVWQRSGAFYSAGADYREVKRYGDVTTGISAPLVSAPGYVVVLDAAPVWEATTGLLVPAFVREAAAIIKFNAADLLASENGSLERILLAPGLGPLQVTALGTLSRFHWAQTINAYHFKLAASINAGPTPCGIVQNGYYADLVLPGLSSAVLTPPPSYTNSAGGIPVTDCIPDKSTFVGAV